MNNTEITKYKTITIQNTPTEKYPTLVTFTKTGKRTRGLLNKQFLTLEHAIKFIDKWELQVWEQHTQMRLEKQEAKKAERELLKLNGLHLITSK